MKQPIFLGVNVDHVAIGHTITNDISLDFDGGVIRTDVNHGIENLNEGQEIFYYNESRILKTFLQVFNNASSRLNWRKIKVKDVPTLKKQWFDTYELTFPKALEEPIKAWEKYYLELKNIFDISDLEKRFDELSLFLLERRKSPRKTESIDAKYFIFFDELAQYQKEFKDFLKIIENYTTKREDFISFNKGMNKIFQYIEKHYYDDSHITHSDLEYLLYKNIDKASIGLEKIIVDEFQDTSFLQCELINKLVSSNQAKMFVGDKKQAIYSFRGGDVEVFENAESELPMLELTHNYRSKSKIVEFNNLLFTQIFSDFIVNQKSQDMGGEINFYDCNENLSGSKIEAIRLAEAKVLVKVIKENLKKPEMSTFAVLYKNLTGVSVLVEELAKEKIPFVAEIKITNDEEPILNLFQYLLKALISNEESEEFKRSMYFIEGLLHFLNVDSSVEEIDIIDFKNDLQLHGLYLSFVLFFSKKGITISKYDVNLLLIKKVCEAFEESLPKIYQYLNSVKGEKVKVYLQEDIKDKYVEVMTIHSSKGLEFDFVAIADLHSENRPPPDSSLIINSNDGIKFKNYAGLDEVSPQYYFNKIQQKIKNIEEEKRLFYVATTRAQQALSFVIFDSVEFKDNGVWTNLLKKYSEFKSEVVEILPREDKSISGSYIKYDFGFRRKSFKKMFKFFPDVSVTGLSKLSVCSHLFYLSEVLKIREDDLRMMDKVFIDDKKEVISSMSRGIKLHLQLERIINGQRENTEENEEIINWVEAKLLKLTDYKSYTEKKIKFSYHKFMISGAADVFFINEKEKKIILWDFKTGLVEKNLINYSTQLKIYLYGITQVFGLQDYESEAYIMSLDEKKVISCKTGSDNLIEFMDDLFENKTNYSLKNLDHCKICSHQLICSK